MKFLITGSEGMIGSRIVEDLLADGHEVIGLDLSYKPKSRYRYYSVDIQNVSDNSDLIESVQDVDFVIHLAARTDLNGSQLDDYDTNYKGSAAFYSFCNELPDVKAVIVVSTQLVLPIGSKPRDVVNLDDTKTNFYGQSKVLMEAETRVILKKKYCIVRPTTIWGPGHNAHYMKFLHYLRLGLYFHPGKQKQLKSYGYLGNAAFQLISICKNHKKFNGGEVFYLCDYEPILLEKYIDDICAGNGWRRPIRLPSWFSKLLAKTGDVVNVLGIPLPFNTFRLNNILTSYVYDTARLQEVVGPLPYTYESAMIEYLDWVHSNFHKVDPHT